MKKFVVALINFFDNDIKQFEVEAEDVYNAFKKAMILFNGDNEKAKQDELEWQSSPDYPTTLEEIEEECGNWEMDFAITEISNNG